MHDCAVGRIDLTVASLLLYTVPAPSCNELGSSLDFPSSEELWEKLRRGFLPLLIIFAVAVPLVILGLRQWDTADFGENQRGECWTEQCY